MILPQPRAYVDWTVPCDKQGNQIGVCKDPTTYAIYLDWLADYLYKTEIHVPPNQANLLAEYRAQDINVAFGDLSECLGTSIWDTDSIEVAFREGQPYSAFREIEQEWYDEMSVEDKKEWLPEDFFTSQEEFDRIGAEIEQSKAVPSNINHADIPYRPVMSALLKDVLVKAKRLELLDSFYSNFNDCASK